MNYQSNPQKAPIPRGFPPVLEDLINAYTQEKSGVFHVTCDDKKVIFSRFRPHEVLSFGIAFKDARTGAVHTIADRQTNITPFSILFRTKKGHESAYLVFETQLELSSDGPTDFVAYFCVKMQELELPVLYTISKCGTVTHCTENCSAKHPLPVHFCSTAFHLLGGLQNGYS